MHAFATLTNAERNPSEIERVRQALQRHMKAALDPRRDTELVDRLVGELRAPASVVAMQLAQERIRVAAQMTDRVRERAKAEGLSVEAINRLRTVSGVQALALATRDAIQRAAAGQQQRTAQRQAVLHALFHEQEVALMERYEQDDAQIAHDFDEAIREIEQEDELLRERG